MKRETAIKRINNAIKRCHLLDTEAKRNKMFKLIWEDFTYFENYETEYTSTQNLNFSIAIWLYDGEEVIKDVIQGL